MNREEFNKLDIKGQVKHFNNELKHDNNNFNAICKSIGISKNTILSRFKKLGYEPVRKGQKISEFLQSIGEKEIKKEQTENLTTENSEVKNKKKASDPREIDLILKRIESLEKKVEILESANLHLDKNLESQDLDYNKNFIKSYENTITKTFKIDLEVYKKLERVFNRYKIYKKQDIVSSLLKYALDNI